MTAPARRCLPQRKVPGQHLALSPQRSPGPCPRSLTLVQATGLTPEVGHIRPAGPGVDPTAQATQDPGAVAGVGGDMDMDEDVHAVAAPTEVGLTAEVIPEVDHTIVDGDPGQTLMTATTAGVAARAGDGVGGAVTATGVQTVDPDRTAPTVAVPPGVGVTVAAVATAEPDVHRQKTLKKEKRCSFVIICKYFIFF